MALFKNRREAGRFLAQALQSYQHQSGLLILALPRGGVPVGYEVAHALGAPLDVFLVRKLGVPGYEELAMGAVASSGIVVRNHDVLNQFRIPEAEFQRVLREEIQELERRERAYRGSRPPPEIEGRTAILVDDGLATGFSMRAAVAALRQKHPRSLIVAVPVAAPETCAALSREADNVICAATPQPFHAVGLWYRDFEPTSDDEVQELLALPASLGGRHEP